MIRIKTVKGKDRIYTLPWNTGFITLIKINNIHTSILSTNLHEAGIVHLQESLKLRK